MRNKNAIDTKLIDQISVFVESNRSLKGIDEFYEAINDIYPEFFAFLHDVYDDAYFQGYKDGKEFIADSKLD